VTPDRLEYETPAEERFELQVRAQDSDDSLEYGAHSPRTDSMFDVASATFIWTPSPSDLGTYDVTFTATDGLVTIDRTVEIEVVPASPDSGDGGDTGETGPDASADTRLRPAYDVRGGGCSTGAVDRPPADSLGWFVGWVLLLLARRHSGVRNRA
jgi:hypothetical protein